jgi:hypothetical protein
MKDMQKRIAIFSLGRSTGTPGRYTVTLNRGMFGVYAVRLVQATLPSTVYTVHQPLFVLVASDGTQTMDLDFTIPFGMYDTPSDVVTAMNTFMSTTNALQPPGSFWTNFFKGQIVFSYDTLTRKIRATSTLSSNRTITIKNPSRVTGFDVTTLQTLTGSGQLLANGIPDMSGSHCCFLQIENLPNVQTIEFTRSFSAGNKTIQSAIAKVDLTAPFGEWNSYTSLNHTTSQDAIACRKYDGYSNRSTGRTDSIQIHWVDPATGKTVDFGNVDHFLELEIFYESE